MNQKKPALGRGLEALMGGAMAATAPRQPGEELARLPLDVLQRGRYQPRRDMRTESLEELAQSIRTQGVIQPIVVRPVGASPGGSPHYEIIAGERRWRAAQLAGLADIPAVIRHVPDEAAIAIALIENIQRENLNPLEEARALSRLISEFRMTHQQAAEAVGRSRVAVSNLLRLLELAPEVGELLEQRALEMGHARALLGLPSRRQQGEVAARVAKDSLSVRATEALVRRLTATKDGKDGKDAKAGRGGTAKDAPAGSADPDVQRLEQELAEKLGARVSIEQGRGGGGRLVVSYHSLEELDGILEHIR